MRIYEITSNQPTKPLTAAQARIRALKHNFEVSKQQLDAERQRQRQISSQKRMAKTLAVG
jgi:hypothetical protein